MRSFVEMRVVFDANASMNNQRALRIELSWISRQLICFGSGKASISTRDGRLDASLLMFGFSRHERTHLNHSLVEVVIHSSHEQSLIGITTAQASFSYHRACSSNARLLLPNCTYTMDATIDRNPCRPTSLGGDSRRTTNSSSCCTSRRSSRRSFRRESTGRTTDSSSSYTSRRSIRAVG